MSSGRVEGIFIANEASAPLHAITSARACAGVGIEGDRYALDRGTWSSNLNHTTLELTLIEAEVLEDVAAVGAAARRNVVTRGIRLAELVGVRFRIGAEVECFGVRKCLPCHHLGRLSGIDVRKLSGRAGLRATIIRGGLFSVGDEIVMLDEPLTRR